ncbi:hypothetical protein F5Y17DRAFT_430870 [Xylariaceae sp. FL0594]|nr:hypothetical protein F5Y17DRAFT_430870 [Xylariaceae sp. FL0594]
MHAIQQKCRPKHQVLVLKCYPRTSKGAVDIKPNSSELSYLLFYATSRRSKIQKIGQFLEKKTASDVWRLRIGNVQVTLQILAALIEKSPKDLPLFAQNVLRILGTILRSDDITMVEASLPTFKTFCEHHDASSLFADQAYLHQYEEVVRAYAACASTRTTPGKGTPSKPVALRWRNAGLQAVQSIASSDALSSPSGRQIDVVVPIILENLWTDDDDFLEILSQRAQLEEKTDSNAQLRRRTSMSTVRTAETAGGDTNPIAISGTSGDIDRLAEEETGVAAMQCLKQIFAMPNRAQLHSATTALLEFIRERINQKEAVVRPGDDGRRDGGWAIEIFDMISRWAPVQDRYAIMVTTMDSLLRSPPTQDNIDEQIALAAIVSSLLGSDINLIGLSVIDVLLGLIQHMKRILRLCESSQDGALSEGSQAEDTAYGSQGPILAQHRDLLTRIQQCMGQLANHVYYADQISDMITAILSQLKPHPDAPDTIGIDASGVSPGPATSTANVSEDQVLLNSYFAKVLAKTTALDVIRSILLVANPKTKLSGNISLRRNKVPIQVWEGTQWLLRDPDGRVRKAYVVAVVTWLDRETTRADLRPRDESFREPARGHTREPLPVGANRRVVSSASAREKPAGVPRSHFLLLIHLAIYDSVLQYIDYDTDITLLHVLLTKMVNKLGVNAARYGVPMIFRLQEDIQEVETPLAKVRLGCLCHGYFWILSEQFDFESSAIGRTIHGEISRRRRKGFWVEGVHVPPPLLTSIGTPGATSTEHKMPIHEIESEALVPFDERTTMVDCICTHYQDAAISPPTSPAASPGRVGSNPILGSTLSAIPVADNGDELPVKFREDMLMEWTREAAIAAIQEGSKSASLNGSKAGTTGTRRQWLAVNGTGANGHGTSRPGSTNVGQNLRPVSHAGTYGAHRKTSVRSHGTGKSSSPRGFVASVEQLKSALTGDPARPQTFHTLREDDQSSDSMTSCDYSPSELSFNPQTTEGNDMSQGRARPGSRDRTGANNVGGPLTSHPTDGGEEDEDAVPPVPPLPASFLGRSPEQDSSLGQLPKIAFQDHATTNNAGWKRNLKSRDGERPLSSNHGEAEDGGVLDLQSLLQGIDTRYRQSTIGNLTRPPY